MAEPVVELLDIEQPVTVQVFSRILAGSPVKQDIRRGEVFIPVIQRVHGQGIGVAGTESRVVPFPSVPHAILVRIANNGLGPDPQFLLRGEPIAVGVRRQPVRAGENQLRVAIHQARIVLGANAEVEHAVFGHCRRHVRVDIVNRGNRRTAENGRHDLAGRAGNILIGGTPAVPWGAVDVVADGLFAVAGVGPPRTDGLVGRALGILDTIKLRGLDRAGQAVADRVPVSAAVVLHGHDGVAERMHHHVEQPRRARDLENPVRAGAVHTVPSRVLPLLNEHLVLEIGALRLLGLPRHPYGVVGVHADLRVVAVMLRAAQTRVVPRASQALPVPVSAGHQPCRGLDLVQVLGVRVLRPGHVDRGSVDRQRGRTVRGHDRAEVALFLPRTTVPTVDPDGDRDTLSVMAVRDHGIAAAVHDHVEVTCVVAHFDRAAVGADGNPVRPVPLLAHDLIV